MSFLMLDGHQNGLDFSYAALLLLGSTQKINKAESNLEVITFVLRRRKISFTMQQRSASSYCFFSRFQLEKKNK